MSCDCSEENNCSEENLYKGTLELIKEMSMLDGDSIYISCRCKNYEVYNGYNFIYCLNCYEHYCKKCEPNLVENIMNRLYILKIKKK